jgi:fused signal recognition particle receptor
MGLFNMEQGLEKTKSSIFSRISKAVVGKSKVDDELLDNLEEILVTSDVGVETTVRIIDRIQKRVAADKYIGTDELNLILKEEIASLLRENTVEDFSDFSVPSDKKPYVIMVVGVNGVGKPPPSANWPTSSKRQGSRCSSAPPTLSAPPRSNRSGSGPNGWMSPSSCRAWAPTQPPLHSTR